MRKSSDCFAFRMPTRYGKYLQEAGFDVLSVANNHAGDFGDAGRVNTGEFWMSLASNVGSDRGNFQPPIWRLKGKR